MPRIQCAILIGSLLMLTGRDATAAGGGSCVTASDCADSDGNGIRDDACVSWACVDSQCAETSVDFGDIGGAFGACTPDGTVDPSDRFHALNCFTNSNTDSSPGYPCEGLPPQAVFIDAGGPNGSCDPDGVCDANDFYHVENVLAGTSPCQCIDPAPELDNKAGATQARIFMAPEGTHHDVAPGQRPTILMNPDETRRIMVWLDDSGPGGTLLNGYQVIVPAAVAPLGDATGTLSYVDQNPGGGGGASVWVDSTRDDWIFNGAGVPLPPAYNETPQLGLFGLFHATTIATGVDPAGSVHYLLEFDITTSADASGTFEIDLIQDSPATPRPLTSLFLPNGQLYGVDEYQGLTIIIGDCLTTVDCIDQDGNGIRDDPCMTGTCLKNSCFMSPTPYGDMGGAYGACGPDGEVDLHDYYHALNCFNDTDTSETMDYPCTPSVLVDIGAPPGICTPDGVCDGADILLAQAAFYETGACACGQPQPQSPTAGRAEIIALARRRVVHPGDEFEIDFFLGQHPTVPLSGFQLHVAARGGRLGQLELVDMTTTPRDDHLFAGRNPWMVFNRTRHQMIAGIFGPGMTTHADPRYLATCTFKASSDASGVFKVGVVVDSGDRTYLFADPLDTAIALVAQVAEIRIVNRRTTRIRGGR